MDPELEEDGEKTGLKDTLLTVPTVLRFTAIALLIVGFIGIFETDADPLAIESVYSLAFVLGIACAGVSIYLGIFLQEE